MAITNGKQLKSTHAVSAVCAEDRCFHSRQQWLTVALAMALSTQCNTQVWLCRDGTLDMYSSRYHSGSLNHTAAPDVSRRFASRGCVGRSLLPSLSLANNNLHGECNTLQIYFPQHGLVWYREVQYVYLQYIDVLILYSAYINPQSISETVRLKWWLNCWPLNWCC